METEIVTYFGTLLMRVESAIRLLNKTKETMMRMKINLEIDKVRSKTEMNVQGLQMDHVNSFSGSFSLSLS